MTTICIIPARGGSKRIPRKNIRMFAGKPMIAHSILAARESGVFDRIVVTTDDQEIMQVAREWGAEVPFVRPPELSNDHAGTDAVVIHSLKWMEQNGQACDYACCLYATAPFARAVYIRQGIELLKKSGAISAFSVTSFPYPIFRALKVTDQDRLEMFWPEHRLTRSQDLPEAYHDAGQFYWMNVQKYLVEGRLFSSDSIPVRLPRHLVQDIDTDEDWVRAELMFKALEQ
jgi:pseudaminic acid cytidylyltransferase